MITNCKNCAGRMVYDIEKSGLCCVSCGTFIPSKDFKLYDTEDDSAEELMNCRVFSCKTCGAKITTTGTEASNLCISCGNPSTVFERITKIRRPKKILPFKVTRESAMEAVEKMKSGRLVPKSFKNAKIEQLHAIYVPYYVTEVEYDGSLVCYKVVKENDEHVRYYAKSSAYASYGRVTTDASAKLNDDTSRCLEPFHLRDAVDFDVNYLTGFYSDIPDVRVDEMISTAKSRVLNDMRERLLEDNPYSDIEDLRADVEVFKTPELMLLPLWALTIRHEDTPYTMLVNGQTGKVVGGLPYDEKRYKSLWAIVSLLVAAVLSPVMGLLAMFVFSTGEVRVAALLAVVFIAILVFSNYNADKQMRIYDESIARTTEKKLNEYSTDRKGGSNQ